MYNPEQESSMTPYRNPLLKDRVVTGFVLVVFTAALAIGAFRFGNTHPAGFALLACVMLLGLVGWHAASSAYRCAECGTEFEISTLRDLVSPHSPTSKYLRCPRCGKRDWASALKKL
jgi:DNA-directed RNA polymerase subunit RPC12/RpoP